MKRSRSASTSTDYRCSFCGKAQHQVKRLIAGPGGVYICNECVALCQEIIEAELSAPLSAPAGPKPRELVIRGVTIEQQLDVIVQRLEAIEQRLGALTPPRAEG